jgi:acyl-coenzyme A thioesterase PaaI-like protein
VSDAAPYPPPQHVLRDLALEVESRPDDTATGWLQVTPHLVDGGGALDPGALAMLVDVLGGGLSIRAVLPDWAATADLALQLLGTDVAPGDTVQADARVVRKGRTTLVTEVDLMRTSDDAPLGWGSMTFSVLPRRDDTMEWRGDDGASQVTRTAFGTDGPQFTRPLVEAVGATVTEPGVVVLPYTDYIRNSFGAVQGGVVAMLGAIAGRSALGGPPVLDLHVAYLAQARTGPIVATADVLGPGAATVRLVDAGAGDRLTTVVHVGTAA